MENKVKKLWIILRVIEALILITVGVLAIVYFKENEFYKWIFIILGVVLTVDGVIRIVRYYIEPITAAAIGENLISSIFEVSFGILCYIPESTTQLVSIFTNLMVYFVAILLFCLALVFIIGPTLSIIHKNRKMWIAIVEYIVAAAAIAGGVVILVKRSDAGVVIQQIMVILVGLFFVALGCFAIATSFKPFVKAKPKKVVVEEMGRKEKKAKKEEKEEQPKEEHVEDVKVSSSTDLQKTDDKPSPDKGENSDKQ